MGKKTDLRKISLCRAYTLKEAADVCQVEERTLYKWRAEGLPLLDRKKPQLFLGADLREWQSNMRRPRGSNPPGTVQCHSCRKAVQPAPKTINFVNMQGRLRLKGSCSQCGGNHLSEIISLRQKEIFLNIIDHGYVHDQHITQTDQTELKRRRLHDVYDLPDNKDNIRLLHEYRRHVEATSPYAAKTIDTAIVDVRRFLIFMGKTCATKYTRATAGKFKRHLQKHVSNKTGHPLKGAIVTSLDQAKFFLRWLLDEQYRDWRAVTFTVNDLEFLNVKDEQRKLRKHFEPRDYPTLNEVKAVLNHLTEQGDDFSLRDAGMIALFAMTGIRVGALRQLMLRHFDAERGLINQNPKEVQTKRTIGIISPLIPIDPLFRSTFDRYVARLRALGWTDDDPLFPQTQPIDPSAEDFTPALKPLPWKSRDSATSKVDKHFRECGFHPYHAQGIRHFAVVEGLKLARNGIEVKALSQALGHKRVSTTLSAYGDLSRDVLIKKIANLGQGHDPVSSEESRF